MGSSVLDTFVPIRSDHILELRAAPAKAPPLPPELDGVVAEVPLRERSERLAALLAPEIGSGNAADWICTLWRAARAGDRLALRGVMSLLEVRLSGVELLREALRPANLQRLFRRTALGSESVRSDVWREVLQDGQALLARASLPIDLLTGPGPEGRERLEKRAAVLLQTLLAGRIRAPELAWLCGLAELELRATAARLGDLAEMVGACDGRRISQLLPVLSKTEERIRDTRALLVRLPAPEDLVRRTPVLMSRFEDDGFDALLREVAARSGGQEVARAMVLVCWRAPLGPELGFLGGVVRTLSERLRVPGQPPLDAARALLAALQARRGHRMEVELTPTELRATRNMWKVLEVPTRTSGFEVAYVDRRHEPLLPEDGLPELIYPVLQRELDLRQAVANNIQNEHVLCGLLGLPRVASMPGLVEMVVVRSRSIKVLLEIANRRELHTGAANRNVPRALLWHPTAVPVSALRKFVHVRFVARAELVALSTRGSRARPEIRQMAAAYLDSLSSG